MFFSEPPPSQFDLNFSLFGIRVRVHPAFWLVSLILGWSAYDMGYEFVLIWIACVFVSVLVHEMGHVLVGMIFGSRGHIVLYSFGGLAIGSSDLDNRWKRIAVLLGGPGAGFVLGGLVVALEKFHLVPFPENFRGKLMVLDALENLLWINIGWGLVNLLPVFPLDGGRISNELWTRVAPRRGLIYCLRLSLLVSAAIAIHSVIGLMATGTKAGWHYPLDFLPQLGIFGALLFGSLAAGSYQMLVAQRQVDRRWDDKWDKWHREREHWDQ